MADCLSDYKITCVSADKKDIILEDRDFILVELLKELIDKLNILGRKL